MQVHHILDSTVGPSSYRRVRAIENHSSIIVGCCSRVLVRNTMILSTGLIKTAMKVLFDDSTPRKNGLQGVAFDVTGMILNNNNTASFSLSLSLLDLGCLEWKRDVERSKSNELIIVSNVGHCPRLMPDHSVGDQI